MTLEQRIEEVQRRYRSDDPVHRAIVRARPELLVASWPPQVVIEAVERGGVEAKLDPGSADRILQVQQAQPDPGGKAIADPFLLSPPTHRFGVRISEDKAHPGPLLGL